ncbi:ACP S-malonyltransferase [Kosakonia cowanii]|uniref:ACP S-malonyltransferase n=1 Tax=Kosakonia cowanii TaxID=208223 RepID=UPI004062EAEA
MSKKNTEKPLVLLFAGQGNPAIGMGADLWDLTGETKHIWDCASDVSGMDLRRLCLKGPMNRLIQTTVQQLAVTAINVTLYTLCQQKFDPCVIAGSCGHSVGEYSALYAAGALSLETLFEVIHFRAKVMHDISRLYKGEMAAVKGIDVQRLRELIDNSGLLVDISCDNSPRQQVIGGAIAPLRDFSRLLLEKGCEPVKLGVSGAWHTRLMTEGVALMRDYLAGVEATPPRHAVVMNVSGKAEHHPEQIKENLARHLTHTVKWRESIDGWLTHKPDVQFVEFSNKAYLAQMLTDFIGFTPEMSRHCKTLLSA